jgi:hypothetical protein
MKPVGFCTLSAHELKVFLSTGIKNPFAPGHSPFSRFFGCLYILADLTRNIRLYKKLLLWPPKNKNILLIGTVLILSKF